MLARAALVAITLLQSPASHGDVVAGVGSHFASGGPWGSKVELSVPFFPEGVGIGNFAKSKSLSVVPDRWNSLLRCARECDGAYEVAGWADASLGGHYCLIAALKRRKRVIEVLDNRHNPKIDIMSGRLSEVFKHNFDRASIGRIVGLNGVQIGPQFTRAGFLSVIEGLSSDEPQKTRGNGEYHGKKSDPPISRNAEWATKAAVFAGLLAIFFGGLCVNERRRGGAWMMAAGFGLMLAGFWQAVH